MSNPLTHLDSDRLTATIEQYPWWGTARIELAKRAMDSQTLDSKSRVITLLHPASLAKYQAIDIDKLTHLSTDDIIDRFLKLDNYRITAEDGVADDLTTQNIEIEEGEEEYISEELAEIYLNQGLYEEAIDTYRKLSLLNSEKSIYFAELIAKIESNMNKR